MTVRGLSGRVERLEAVDKIGGREPMVIERHHEMSDDEATQRSGAHRRGRVPRAPWRAAIHIVVGVPQVTTVMVTTGEWVLPAGSPDRRPRM